eukprot:8119234-Pyramimonas_sp.AAC.1
MAPRVHRACQISTWRPMLACAPRRAAEGARGRQPRAGRPLAEGGRECRPASARRTASSSCTRSSTGP